MSPCWSDRLSAGIDRVGAPVCVGLDPVLESMHADLRARHHEPAAAVREFTRGVLHAVAEHAAAVKFQSACYERYGEHSWAAMHEGMIEAARLGMAVLWDAKRGDISTSAGHYAAAAQRLGAHCVTVSGYMGRSAVTPFLEAGLGAFVLVRTSNPDSDAVQGLRLSDGRTVAEMMADEVRSLGAARLGSCGLSDVGAVVGATKSGDAAALRARMPEQIFLVPGYGAQGGTAEDVRSMLRPDGRGVLITASRSIIYAKSAGAEPWTDAVKHAAERMRQEIAAVIAGS